MTANRSKARIPRALLRLAADGDVVALEPRLEDLTSVGPATLQDFEVLGVHSVPQLARCQPEQLYERLCRATGARHDPCVQDVFAAAIAQARDPFLPAEQKQWWYWSRLRKAGQSTRRALPAGRR